MQINFYHLTATPLDRALPQIAQKVVASGGRLLIVSEGEAQRDMIDRTLWSYAPDSFLPHAQVGGEHDEAQPILITPMTEALNGARFIALVDGLWRDAALGFERVFHFFDDDRIGDARIAWKGLGARDDITRQYWKQNDAGRWEQAA